MPVMDDDRRALLRHCAERVLGWVVISHDAWGSGITGDCVTWERVVYRLSAGNVLMEPWDPTRNWADAGQLWERVREKGIILRLTGCRANWEATSFHPLGFYADADSGPLALTLAVARATGYQVEEPIK